MAQSQEQKTVRFEATGNMSDFMKKMQSDGRAMYESFSKEAQKQAKTSRDQQKLIRDQISALKEQLKVEKELTNERLKRNREELKDTIGGNAQSKLMKQIAADEAYLSNIKNQQRGTRRASTLLSDEKSDRNLESGPPVDNKGVFNSVMLAGMVRDIFGLIKRAGTANTEYDLITPFASMAGAGIGAAAGLFMSPGTTIAGKEIGSFAGAGYTRHLMARENFLASANRVSALAERNAAGDLSGIGSDRVAGAQLEESIVRAISKGTTAQQIRNIAAISKAYAIDTSTLNNFLGTGRMGGRVNEGMLLGLQQNGITRAQLGDATMGLTGLLNLMGSKTMIPNSAAALQKIIEGNNLGGGFSASDPRSAGFLASIQNNLTDPKTAIAQALSYKVLRKIAGPNASPLELAKLRQEGGVQYDRAILDEYSKMTGSSDFAAFAYSSAFGTGNLAVDEHRLKNKEKIAGGGIATVKMGREQEEELYRNASRMTTELQKSQAAVSNAFVESFTEGISTLAERFTDKMTEAVEKWVDSKIDSIMGKKPTPRGR